MRIQKIERAVVFSLLLFGCINKAPENILPREKKCEHCNMGITQMMYHSQIITPKGRKVHFDSIECMISYWIKDEAKAEKLYVKNFSSPNEWIDVQNSFFLKSEKLSSPMSANLSSYKNLSNAQVAKDEFGGNILQIAELKNYIKSEWANELSKKSNR